MFGRFCFVVAAILFFLEAIHVVNQPMIVWGLFALALGLAVGGWSPSWPWKKASA